MCIRDRPTSVEKGGDEVWIGEKFQSNPEIAGSPRNSFRASLGVKMCIRDRDYATKDAAGIVRQDLLLTAAENFNEVTAKMEKLGLVILKDENGDVYKRQFQRSGVRTWK